MALSYCLRKCVNSLSHATLDSWFYAGIVLNIVQEPSRET
jgi:hypothetical protein